jgi:hypothetical protein
MTEMIFVDADERAYFDRFGFVVRAENRGTLDDGVEFVTLRFGDPVKGEWATQEFMHERAFEDAASFVAAMEESVLYTLEERLGPFGLEWEREQEDRRNGGW